MSQSYSGSGAASGSASGSYYYSNFKGQSNKSQSNRPGQNVFGPNPCFDFCSFPNQATVCGPCSGQAGKGQLHNYTHGKGQLGVVPAITNAYQAVYCPFPNDYFGRQIIKKGAGLQGGKGGAKKGNSGKSGTYSGKRSGSGKGYYSDNGTYYSYSQSGQPGGPTEEEEEIDENHGICWNFCPEPDRATELTFTIEPKKKPLWHTMMRMGFFPIVPCQAAPNCYRDGLCCCMHEEEATSEEDSDDEEPEPEYYDSYVTYSDDETIDGSNFDDSDDSSDDDDDEDDDDGDDEEDG